METMTLEQLLTRARTIMTDIRGQEEFIIPAMQASQSKSISKLLPWWASTLQLQQSGPCSKKLCEQKTKSACVLLSLQQSRTYGSGLPGKQGQGRDDIHLFSRQTMNEMLPLQLLSDHFKWWTLPCLEEEECQGDHYKW